MLHLLRIHNIFTNERIAIGLIIVCILIVTIISHIGVTMFSVKPTDVTLSDVIYQKVRQSEIKIHIVEAIVWLLVSLTYCSIQMLYRGFVPTITV